MAHYPTFLINLDKDETRLSFMTEQLRKLGITFERVHAFYGDDPKVLASYDEELAKKENSRPLTKGERGCAYSHQSIYEKMKKESIPVALILEDDVVLPSDFADVIDRELSRTERRWEWLIFDYPNVGPSYLKKWFIASKKMTQERKLFLLYALIKFPYVFILSSFEYIRDCFATMFPSIAGPRLFLRPLYHAGAYLVTLEGVEKLLKLSYPLRFSADRLPNQSRIRSGLKLYGYVPLIVHQDKTFESNIT